MASFNFTCAKCGKKARKLLAKAPDKFICVCGHPMDREGAAPTTRSTEVLDNGWMSKPLERLDNAEQIFKDRAHGTDGRDPD